MQLTKPFPSRCMNRILKGSELPLTFQSDCPNNSRNCEVGEGRGWSEVTGLAPEMWLQIRPLRAVAKLPSFQCPNSLPWGLQVLEKAAPTMVDDSYPRTGGACTHLLPAKHCPSKRGGGEGHVVSSHLCTSKRGISVPLSCIVVLANIYLFMF